MSSQSLTSHLLSLHQEKFTRATQSPFLARAASGTLPKSLISHWLANDRLYMQGYIRLSGELLRILQLPARPTPSKSAGCVSLRLLDWLVDALVNIRREERFFMDVAERFNLDVDLIEDNAQGSIPQDKKIEGLKRYEELFDSLTSGQTSETLLPWLEGVVLFWATEKVYFEAWSWAKRQAEGAGTKYEEDADGGAMRKEFIPNWTNDEFIKFVDTLEAILNEGVEEAHGGDETLRRRIEERAEKIWNQLLDAEEAFWPETEGN